MLFYTTEALVGGEWRERERERRRGRERERASQPTKTAYFEMVILVPDSAMILLRVFPPFPAATYKEMKVSILICQLQHTLYNIILQQQT